MSIKFSIVEKRLFRSVLLFIFVQVLIVLGFVCLSKESRPIDESDTKQINIVVKDTYYFRTFKEYKLVVYTDSSEYWFTSGYSSGEYSVSQLNKTLSKGDRLSVRYYESNNISGDFNLIIDARNETETYRSFENYNKRKENLIFFVIIIFVVFELLFCVCLFIFIYIHIRDFRQILKKMRFRTIKRKNYG